MASVEARKVFMKCCKIICSPNDTEPSTEHPSDLWKTIAPRNGIFLARYVCESGEDKRFLIDGHPNEVVKASIFGEIYWIFEKVRVVV